jgi:hypothetical protein
LVRRERKKRRIFRWLQIGEGRPAAAAPWRGGAVCCSFPHREQRKGKSELREEKDGGGAMEGERLGFGGGRRGIKKGGEGAGGVVALGGDGEDHGACLSCHCPGRKGKERGEG